MSGGNQAPGGTARDAAAGVGLTRLLAGAVLLMLALLIGVLLYKAWPMLHPPVLALAPLDPACDLRAGPCRARFADGGAVTLAIQPREIPVVTPLTLTVDVEGLVARSVEVDFAGVDMNMGFNRVALTGSGEGGFTGEAMLPVCVRSSMTWEAKVLVAGPDGTRAAPFRFETYR